MLKIKDNIDLKELEKFGAIYNKEMKKYDFDGEYLYVWEDTRYIESEMGFITEIYNLMEILFDLIQAGLVEKVADNG